MKTEEGGGIQAVETTCPWGMLALLQTWQWGEAGGTKSKYLETWDHYI